MFSVYGTHSEVNGWDESAEEGTRGEGGGVGGEKLKEKRQKETNHKQQEGEVKENVSFFVLGSRHGKEDSVWGRRGSGGAGRDCEEWGRKVPAQPPMKPVTNHADGRAPANATPPTAKEAGAIFVAGRASTSTTTKEAGAIKAVGRASASTTATDPDPVQEMHLRAQPQEKQVQDFDM